MVPHLSTPYQEEYHTIECSVRDYIAARVPLNSDYTLQGVMLASTAIEKYFKAAICLFTKNVPHVHLHKFEKIKK